MLPNLLDSIAARGLANPPIMVADGTAGKLELVVTKDQWDNGRLRSAPQPVQEELSLLRSSQDATTGCQADTYTFL